MLLAVGLLVVGALAPVATAQSTAPETHEDGANVTIPSDDLEGETYHDETVTVENLTPFDDGTVELRKRNGTSSYFVGDAEVGDDGSFTIDTYDLVPGRYLFRDATGDHGPFEVFWLDISLGATTVTDDTAALVLENESRGAPLDLLVSPWGEFSRDDPDAERLEAVFGGGAYETSIEGDSEIRVHDVREGDAVPIDVGDFEPGTYELSVQVPNSRAYDTAGFVVAPDDVDAETEASDLDGAAFWSGQTVAIENVTPRDDGTVELLADDEDGPTLVGTVDVASDGRLALRTRDREPGSYVLRDGDGERGPFAVREQTIETASFEPAATQETATFEVASNRAAYDLRIDAPGIDAETFAAAFDAGAVRDGSFVLPVAEGSASVEVDATALRAGDHAVTVAVDDADASAVRNLTVYPDGRDDTTFVEDAVSDHVGDVVAFDVRTAPAAESLWLTLRGEDADYEATVRLAEIDQAEPITVEWNTHLARDASADAGLDVDGATVANVSVAGPENGTHLPDAEDGATVHVGAHHSAAAAAAGNATDELRVDLAPLQAGAVTTSVARGADAHEAHDVDDELEAILADATERDVVANRDLLVAEVNVSGVFGYLNATPATFTSEGLAFELWEQTDTAHARSHPLSEFGNRAAVVERPASDTVYVVLDAFSIPGTGTSRPLDVRFTVDGAENPYVADESAGPEVVANASVTYDARRVEIVGDALGDRLLLPTRENAEITAETNIAPGTEFQLWADLPEDDFRISSGTVAEDGTLTGDVYLANVAPGTPISEVRIRVPHRYTEATSPAVTYDPDDPTVVADADAPANATVGENATIDAAVENVGTEATTADVRVTVDGDRVLERSLSLDPGERATIRHDHVAEEVGLLDWSVEAGNDTVSGRVPVGDGFELHGYRPLPYDGQAADGRLHHDVTGDGVLSASDVVVFFRHQHLPAWSDRPDRFDFDGDGRVGQGDVIELFRILSDT